MASRRDEEMRRVGDSRRSADSAGSRTRQASACVIAALGLAVGLSAWLAIDPQARGQSSFSKKGEVLHEYVTPPASGGSSGGGGGGGDDSGGGGGGRGGGDGSSPIPDRPEPSSADPTPGDNQTRQDSISPDTETVHEGRLVYHTSFNPTVAPFKRFTAVDSVRDDFTLAISDKKLRRVARIDESGVSGRDFFWGTWVVAENRGEPIPIPSVSPDMLVHRVRVRPRGFMATFHKDGADNFYVKLRRTSRRRASTRRIRVQALVSGPRSYFGGQLPAQLSLDDLNAPRPKLPSAVARKANLVLSNIGAHRTGSLNDTLHRLVSYFRGFRQGKLSVDTGITYVDLALSQRGVCRHRSYAFTITAQAAGIPARYVQNEAHAFVEVLLPRLGWRRIDLGGASPQLDIPNGSKRRPHVPPPDPFGWSSRSRQSSGTSSRSAAGLRDPRRQADPSSTDGASAPRSSKPVDLSKRVEPGTWVDGAKLGLATERESAAPSIWNASSSSDPDESASSEAATEPSPGEPDTPSASEPSTRLPRPPATPSSRQPEVSMGSARVESTGVRGSPFRVSGSLEARGEGVSGHRVVILLHPPGSRDAVVVGETVTGSDGQYSLRTVIPDTIPVGVYRVVAHSPAQRGHQGATSP